MAVKSGAAGGLLDYLPAIYRDDAFFAAYLSAFEQILIGDNPADPGLPKSLESSITEMSSLFDPLNTPPDFLPWLAGWTAFSMRGDLDLEKQRQFISQIIQLYNWRGTKKNLQDLLAIFNVSSPSVDETGLDECQVGVHSTIGKDMWLGGDPHYFHVTISLTKGDPAVVKRQMEIAKALIELEKPAHTYYRIDAVFPSMQIGVQSTIGIDTLLGTVPKP